MSLNIPQTDHKRIVVIGGGFGGLAFVKALEGLPFEVVLIDRNNFHLFKPLLYQVATAELEASDIAFPFRKLFSKNRNIHFRMAELKRILTDESIIETSRGELNYDYLLIATGCVPNFFGINNIIRHSMPMSNLEDGVRIRNSILQNMELALSTDSPSQRRSLMTIVIVGGGASGVEIAGAMAEMRNNILPRDYVELDSSLMNIYLVEGGNKILSTLSEKSSIEALQELKQLGIKVMLGSTISDYQSNKALLSDGSYIPTHNLIWTTGVKCPNIEGLNDQFREHGGRIAVDSYNRIKGLNNVFAIGDVAIMRDKEYPTGHPQVARVAISQGKHLANNIIKELLNINMTPYRYNNHIVMATLGRNRAFVECRGWQVHGFKAWALWSLVHISSILGAHNKIRILTNWASSYFGKDKPLRLIINGRERTSGRSTQPPEMPPCYETHSQHPRPPQTYR